MRVDRHRQRRRGVHHTFYNAYVFCGREHFKACKVFCCTEQRLQ